MATNTDYVSTISKLLADQRVIYWTAKMVISMYWNSIAAQMPANDEDEILGTTMTKAQMIACVVQLENFIKLIENQAPATSAYLTTLDQITDWYKANVK